MRRTPVLIAALALVLGACGSSGTTARSSATAAVPAPSRLVTIKGFNYRPSRLRIVVGTTLQVVNKDSEPHTLTADDKSFDTGNIEKGKSKALTLGTPGTYHYYCTLHPYMKGTITVQ